MGAKYCTLLVAHAYMHVHLGAEACKYLQVPTWLLKIEMSGNQGVDEKT